MVKLPDGKIMKADGDFRLRLSHIGDKTTREWIYGLAERFRKPMRARRTMPNFKLSVTDARDMPRF